MNFIDNQSYDRLLAENVIMIKLYDSSANNTIIECIARQTPILVNPIAAVVEYLGAEYPLYYNTLEEAAAKAADYSILKKTHEYLKNIPIRPKMTPEYFVRSFTQSKIYQSL